MTTTTVATGPRSIGHVFVINLENEDYATTWGASSPARFLNRTLVGRTVKASAENPDLARVQGINPKLVSTAVWSIAVRR